MDNIFSGVDRLILILVIGLVAGYLAALVMKERRMGLLGYTVVGVIGSFVGHIIFRIFWVSLPGEFQPLVAFVGAVILILFLRLFRPRSLR
ncbi:MAG: GlsB/YeaQ/YmgE family stress response membrane protein [Bauldia litoralis]